MSSNMIKLLIALVFFVLISITSCQEFIYHGPFLLWGPPAVKELTLPALQAIDDEKLIGLYDKTNTIVIVCINGDNQSIPEMRQIVGTSSFIYLPQSQIPLPVVDNTKTHIIHLSGTSYEQDVINRLNQIQRTAGKNLLGILASIEDRSEIRRKRGASDTSTTMVSPTDEPMQEDFIYQADGKAILYTTSAPILTMYSNSTDDKPIVKELRAHGIVTVDEREQFWRLSVTFAVSGGKTTLRFKFPIASGYWSLTSVEVADRDFNGDLIVVGEAPEAPIGFSHKCSRPLVFRNGLTNLTLEFVQVQPLLAGANRFGDAYDCVGFTTVPIWSGIFVSFIILLGTSIGIIALLEIKTPNRFESSRSKQLTFTVQE